jgi:predicted transglutaminase-like cysteine proteinase
VVLDQKRAPLAVRVLRGDVGDFVLDVLTKRIRPWEKIGYAFLRMQDPRDPSGWGRT